MKKTDHVPQHSMDQFDDINEMLSNDQSELEKIMKELADIKYALDQSSIVGITDQRGTILSVNEKFCEISQYKEEELIGQNHRLLNSNYHDKTFFKKMWATIGKGKTFRGEIRNRTKLGDIYWVDTTIVPLLNEQGKPYRYVSIRNDISQRKIIEQEIKRSEEMFRFITGNSSDLISIVDRTGKFHYVSPSHELILKVKISSFDSIYTADWINQTDKERIMNELYNLIKTNKTTSQIEFQIQVNDLTSLDAKMSINAIFDPEGVINKLILVTRDVTEQKKHEETIHHLAYHDVLTNLPNRRHFMNTLRDEIISKTNTITSFAILLINIDRFKYINDSMGHEVGDYILIKVAERIAKSLDSNDHISRLGGDEFAVILEGTSNKEEIELAAAKVLKSVGRTIHVARQKYNLSCSIGITTFPDNGKKGDMLLNSTDTALSTVKERGGGGYAFYNKEMNEKSLERIMLENELGKAIELEQFHLDYQPKIDFLSNKVIGMEALVRWNHPDLGLIPPNNFISLAEETGLILPLGLWVLEEACKQNKTWQSKGYPLLIVSVNLSVKQLMDEDIVKQIKEVLLKTELEPKWLELEITESTFADITHASTLLQEIRDIGVQISIDDFGTGYSSFNYIKHLPIDTLKIDASFIRDIHENEDSQAIVKAMLTLANTLGINVIAEGIELREQSIILNAEGCKQGQGYLFSRPLRSDKFEAYIIDHFMNKG